MKRARRMSADAAVAKMIKYHARSGLFYSEGNFKIISGFFYSDVF